MTSEVEHEVGTDEGEYLQFGIPGVRYSAVRVRLSDDARDVAERIDRALKASQYLARKYAEAFPDAPPEDAPRQSGAPSQGQASTPKCNTHNRAMKQSQHGGWYCTAKLADGSYCKERAD